MTETTQQAIKLKATCIANDIINCFTVEDTSEQIRDKIVTIIERELCGKQ